MKFCEIFKNTYFEEYLQTNASKIHFFSGSKFWKHFLSIIYIAQKTKFSIMAFFSKCDQILRKLRIGSHLPTKFLI